MGVWDDHRKPGMPGQADPADCAVRGRHRRGNPAVARGADGTCRRSLAPDPDGGHGSARRGPCLRDGVEWLGKIAFVGLLVVLAGVTAYWRRQRLAAHFEAADRLVASDDAGKRQRGLTELIMNARRGRAEHRRIAGALAAYLRRAAHRSAGRGWPEAARVSLLCRSDTVAVGQGTSRSERRVAGGPARGGRRVARRLPARRRSRQRALRPRQPREREPGGAPASRAPTSPAPGWTGRSCASTAPPRR